MERLDTICVGELEIRPHEHLVLVGEQEVPLTSREFDIMMMLAEHPGWTCSASQLAGDLAEGDYSPESISVLVARLRKKFAAVGAHALVETVRGVGYRLSTSASERDGGPVLGGANRALRDATWQLHEAVIEVERTGNPEQQREVSDVLDRARREVFATLAK